LTYAELVQINKALIDGCSEFMRFYVLRNQATQSAIYVEDLLISRVRVRDLHAERKIYYIDQTKETKMNTCW
jgi:hypothetical protein